ncbi:MAG: 3-phosphoshikimate 1-carboxyvinyltransferase [Candidatus Hydrogenedentes bacterium]|nr:3-phosphoshikimate 1-carboxyvinyltransferase [Candidatus Hydrogenedentota bacterium]
MQLIVEGSTLQGEVEIPGSKSHTIRAVAIAALAQGESHIRCPLDSADTRASVHAYRALGAQIHTGDAVWHVHGTGGALRTPEDVIDVRNSGTTMNVALGSAALLGKGAAILTGDEQVRRRPNGPLAAALNKLGASVRSTRNNGCPPFIVKGRLKGGECTIKAMTSQYVTSLLMNCPLAEKDTHLDVPLMYEKPYVNITLDWLARQGAKVEYDAELTDFRIPGGQQYLPVDRRIPGDFSSATFFLAAGALSDNEVLCRGLDMSDTQGDKAVVNYLEQMGASISHEREGIRVRAQGLRGCEIDLNATPDALPMMAAVGCFAKGRTRLVNVPQARLKETDRITVMRQELEKLGAKIRELKDGLEIEESGLHGGEVEGHGDHRVVMSLAIAATMLPGTTRINGYEAVNVTFPGFQQVLQGLGARVRVVE